MSRRAGLLALAALAAWACTVPLPPGRAADSAGDVDSFQDIIFLSETRPIFIRLRIDEGGKGFRLSWLDAVKLIHASLDKDGDGTVTREEAERGSLPSMVRAVTGGAAALPRAELDSHPKDGKVSLDELADVLRPALGPFRIQVGRVAIERTDALFIHLDRDRNGTLSREELAAAVSSLRRFDLDDDELIDPAEMDPFSNPIATQYEEDLLSRGRYATVPPVIDLAPDDVSVRPVRLILRKYDTGAKTGAAAGDNLLSPDEFKIDPKDFEAADTDHSGALDTQELRGYLARIRPDMELNVVFPTGGKTPATIEPPGASAKPLPRGVKVQRLATGDLEVAVGEVNLEFHVDGGENAIENAKRAYAGQFQAADTDNNKYLEKSEANNNGPFSSMFEMMDRDGDGKLYLKEVEDFIERQARIARSQVVLAAADQGRAIFAIMDLNRDRHLGVREIRNTVARVSLWDRNGDGLIGADEIPHHYQMTISRGQITPMGRPALVGRLLREDGPPATAPSGPSWFRRMDRNKDGDVSRREFLGPRAAFDRLDRDGDGLIDVEEAARPTG
jgi:Ca2+-binding EF-hand superfamily protein